MVATSRRQSGFTLTELMITVGLVSLMAVVAVPAYNGYMQRARNAQAIADIGAISLDVDRFRLSNGDTLPPNLAAIGRGDLRDPWGNPYRYLVVAGANPGALRKDRNLVPINTDFDLYSPGPDGASAAALTANPSRDDIVRANNGNFIGLAKEY